MDCHCQFFHYLQRKPYRKLSFCSAPRTISLVMESLSSLRRFSIRPLNKSWFWARYVRPEKYHSVYKLCLYLRYGDMLLESKGEHFKVYSISTRLPVNNHQSFFFYLNIFVFRSMKSFCNIPRCLATAAWKPCLNTCSELCCCKFYGLFNCLSEACEDGKLFGVIGLLLLFNSNSAVC